MAEAEFWELILLLGGSTDARAVERLTDALRDRGERAAVQFQERLAATLFQLDRQVLFEQVVRWADEDPDGEPLPLSDDTFLYLRACVVAQGPRTVASVLADPEELTRRTWDDGELLLFAATEAAGHDIDTAVSYETGSNVEHWDPPQTAGEPFVPPTHGGVFVLSVCDLSLPIEAYRSETDRELVPIMYQFPPWMSFDAWVPVTEVIGTIIHQNGGVPASCGGNWIRLEVGLGTTWQLTPERGRFGESDDAKPGEIHLRVELPQAQVRALSEHDQLALLTSVAASVALAVLPADHPARPQLIAQQEPGAALLRD